MNISGARRTWAVVSSAVSGLYWWPMMTLPGMFGMKPMPFGMGAMTVEATPSSKSAGAVRAAIWEAVSRVA